MKKKQRIVFFGSPEFSLAPLKTLYLGGYEIVGVYTQEPKKKSRGMKEITTPVHQWAESQLLPVFTPVTLNQESIHEFQSLKPDVAILFAYGKIIPKAWLDIPLYGFINIHASLLPKWRGAAPVQRSIENNDEITGISIMKMNEKLDEGPVLASQEIPITKETNGLNLINQMSLDSCSLLFNTLEKYFLGKIKLHDQDSSLSSYANKINKIESKINWSEKAATIERKIRAFYPYPAMWFDHEGKRYKVLKSKISNQIGKVGEIIDTPLIIACGDQSLEVLEIQAEGKKAVSIDNFILGNANFKKNDFLR
ncbi:MAG: methionyl-tRNA formyltransferase [Pelagibacteraceae bacterium]|jgi:methionyl-tRNA formyltransferase